MTIDPDATFPAEWRMTEAQDSLLFALMEACPKYVSPGDLHQLVTGEAPDDPSKASTQVRSVIQQVRDKLAKDYDTDDVFIETRRYTGYRVHPGVLRDLVAAMEPK